MSDFDQVKTYFLDKLSDYKSVDPATAPPITTVTLERYEDPSEGDFDVLIRIPEWEAWNADLSEHYIPNREVQGIWLAIGDSDESAGQQAVQDVLSTLNTALGR